MFVIGTAGHVDHGKSTLVHALTGIDPDRLAEEKAREMTIELGFAWFKLPSGLEVSVIDVPGHEHFIKNMLAGVSGMDLALLVVAANESIKPQTREHLAILDLMEVPQAIMVITQSDLVDQDQVTLVGMEIEDLIRPTRFAGAPIVPVSAVTEQGLDELKATIDKVLSNFSTQARYRQAAVAYRQSVYHFRFRYGSYRYTGRRFTIIGTRGGNLTSVPELQDKRLANSQK